MKIPGLARSTRWLGALTIGFAMTLAARAAAPAGETPGRLDYIDEMLRAGWEGAKIAPSKPADDAEFVRRAYLDFLGRIPTAQEASVFLENKDKDKRIKLVEYLLADPDYPKNFANQWTVILIGRGRQEREVNRPALTSWLRRQFGENRPWNEMARELITAKGSNKDNGATNFTLAHMENGAVPITSLTTRVFLGQQIQCTQCHDHPSNDWKQEQFWAINAFYKGVKRRTIKGVDASGKEVDDHTDLYDEPADGYAKFERRNGELRIAYPAYLDGRKISPSPDVVRRDELGKFITAEDNIEFPQAFVNRMWFHFMGRGIVHPVDDFGPHNPPSHPELLERLGADFAAYGYDVKALIRWITSSQAYHLTSVATPQNEKDEALFSHMALKPMNPEQLFDSLLVATAAHKTGSGDDMDRKRDQWLRQFVFTFGNDEGEENTSFQGTIPQALMMMNGELMNNATGPKAGTFIAQTIEEAQRQRRSPEQFALNRIYLAALSRLPSRDETARLSKMSAGYPDTAMFLRDVFWALLNSNEFVLNH
ncbi:MAG: DUF1549 and DUF1553 domain-containing protein [Isosphaeraceae bacterium]